MQEVMTGMNREWTGRNCWGLSPMLLTKSFGCAMSICWWRIGSYANRSEVACCSQTVFVKNLVLQALVLCLQRANGSDHEPCPAAGFFPPRGGGALAQQVEFVLVHAP